MTIGILRNGLSEEGGSKYTSDIFNSYLSVCYDNVLSGILYEKKLCGTHCHEVACVFPKLKVCISSFAGLTFTSSPQFCRVISMKIFAVFAGKVDSC